MAGHGGGPWGGGNKGGGTQGGGNSDDDRDDHRGGGAPGGGNMGGGRRPGDGQQIGDIEDLVKKGQDQLRVLMGGRGGAPRGPSGGGGGDFPSPKIIGWGLAALAVVLWAFASFYTVRPEQRSVELFLGKFYRIGMPGLNFAPWPVVTAQVVPTLNERTTDIGNGQGGPNDTGLMLTRDQNIVDVHFQVVWNIEDPAKFLFNLADPTDTVRAVSESAMREIIANTDLAPILNKDRGVIAAELMRSVQETLDSYGSGIRVIRVNFDSADPPKEVIDSFRAVQAAQQQRDKLINEADAYANKALGAARGEAAQIQQEAEGYRAQTVNLAKGEASRFLSVYNSYRLAPAVTRERLYLDTVEQVLSGVHKVILDGVSGKGGGGVMPYLPLNDLLKSGGMTTKGVSK